MYQVVADPGGVDITPSARRKLQEFVNMMEAMRVVLLSMTLTDLVRKVLQETGYKAALEQDKKRGIQD